MLCELDDESDVTIENYLQDHITETVDLPPPEELFCLIHAIPPIPKNFMNFVKHYTALMFTQFLRGFSIERKRAFHLQLQHDERSEDPQSLSHMEIAVRSNWIDLLPTICQTRSLIRRIYGKYPLMESHILPHDAQFRKSIIHNLAGLITEYIIDHRSLFNEPSR